MADAWVSGYDDSHRAFLQALLAGQSITLEDAKPLIANIQTARNPDRPTLPQDVSQADLDSFTQAINRSISPLDMEIRSTLHQTTRVRVYALINTTSDALTQMATLNSPDEMAFIKRILDAMFDTNNTREAEVMSVKGMHAIRLGKAPSDTSRRTSSNPSTAPSNITSLTLAQAQLVLDRMETDGWFERSRRGYYCLSPRALMELRGWLMDTYGDEDDEDGDADGRGSSKIKFCQACKDIVTIGQRCSDLDCSARMHHHCVRNMFRAQQNREQCPTCRKPWTDPLLVGEEAAGANRRRSSGANLTQLQNSVVVDDDDDLDDA